MFCWRITKYNPKFRNLHGAYLKNEWTSYSDIGKVFNNKKLTLEEYLKIENAYVNAIIFFMECLNLDSLYITNLEKYNKPEKNYSSHMIDAFDTIKKGDILTIESVSIISRLSLRENLWCKLKTKNMYIHFGYDYYLYMGSKKPCKETIAKIEKSNLFVEAYKSPYNQSDLA